MEKVRGFEVAKGFEDKNINLPVRKTKRNTKFKFRKNRNVSNN